MVETGQRILDQSGNWREQQVSKMANVNEALSLLDSLRTVLVSRGQEVSKAGLPTVLSSHSLIVES